MDHSGAGTESSWAGGGCPWEAGKVRLCGQMHGRRAHGRGVWGGVSERTVEAGCLWL